MNFIHDFRDLKGPKYYSLLCMLFIIIQIGSDLLNFKMITFYNYFPATTGLYFFPIIFSINNIVTEVYGYTYSIRMIWYGIISILFFIFMVTIALNTSPAAWWHHTDEFTDIMSFYRRCGFASIVSYFIGFYTNSIILSKTKIMSKGNYLWGRIFISSCFGIAINSTIYLTLCFIGKYSLANLVNIIITGNCAKVLYDVCLIPPTYILIYLIKKDEKIDIFDKNVNYKPFSFEFLSKK